jgi:hypothetical protein
MGDTGRCSGRGRGRGWFYKQKYGRGGGGGMSSKYRYTCIVTESSLKFPDKAIPWCNLTKAAGGALMPVRVGLMCSIMGCREIQQP